MAGRDRRRAAGGAGRRGSTWVRATGATPAEFDLVAAAFGLHALTIEDVRPTTEALGGSTVRLLTDADLRRDDQDCDGEVDDGPAQPLEKRNIYWYFRGRPDRLDPQTACEAVRRHEFGH